VDLQRLRYISGEILPYNPTTLADVAVIGYGDDAHQRLQRVAADMQEVYPLFEIPDNPAACRPKTEGSQPGIVLRRRLMWEQRHE